MNELTGSPFFGIALTVVAYWIGVKIQKKTGLVICNSFYEGAALAGAGYGAAVLPRLWAQPEPGCVFVPLDYPEQFHIGLFTRADAPADVQDFCRAAAQVCAGDTGSPVLM